MNAIIYIRNPAFVTIRTNRSGTGGNEPMRNSLIHLIREFPSMSSVAFRGLRLAFGIVFVFGAAMFVAPAAHAQFNGQACMDPSDIPELFFTDFVGLDNCKSLCKKNAGYCRKFVKDAGSCEQVYNKGYYFFIDKLECDTIVDPVERKACHEAVGEWRGFIKDGIKAEVLEMLDSCDAYLDGCLADCDAPML